MQRDDQSAKKLPGIIASIRQALFLPQDAKAALKEIIDSPGRHKAIYFHQAAQEQGLLAALTQIAYQKKRPHCVLSLSNPSSLSRLLTEVCLQEGKLQKIKGPLALCIEQGGILILKRDNVPNNVLEGLNSLWSTDLDEKFHQIPLHPYLQVILISAMTAPQLSPAASGRFQHLLLHPETMLSHSELKTVASIPQSACIIDLAFKDSLAAEEQLTGALKRDEKTYAWAWQEGQLISLLCKHQSKPLTVHLEHADCAQHYLQDLLIKQQAGVHLTANGVSWDLSLLQLTLAPVQIQKKTHPKIFQKNLSRVSSQQARQSHKRLYMIHHENHYQPLFSLAGTQIVDSQPEWVLSPGYLDALDKEEDYDWAILVAAPLTLAQWYGLLNESRILHLWVLEEIFIPKIFQNLFQPYALDSKESPKDLPKPKPVTHTQFVISRDLNYAIDWLSQRNPEALKIFISTEHNAQNLFNQYDAKKNHSPGLLWQALQQNKEVILIGLEYQPELAAELQCLWNGISLININGRLEKRTQGRLIILLDSSHSFPGFACYNKRLFYLGSKQLNQQLKNYIPDPVEHPLLKVLAKALFHIHENASYANARKKLEISLNYNALKRLLFLYGFARRKKKLEPAQAIGHSLYYGLIIRLKQELDTVNYQRLLQETGKFFAPQKIIWPTSHNEWSDRSLATTISLEAHPLVFLAGPTATGKSQIAVQLAQDNHYQIFGPLTLGPDTSFEDMATLVHQWASAKPVKKNSRLLLFLDEVTLAAEQSLEWLNGVLGLSLMLPNGKHYALTPKHAVLMGGNLNYAGRTLHRFIQNNALIIPFPAFSVDFLQKQVVKPILEKFLTPPLSLTLANLDLIQEILFDLYEKVPLLEPQHRLDARTLTAILAHFEAYRSMDLNTPWQGLFHLACFQVVLNGLLPAHNEALYWHLQQKLGYKALLPQPVISSYLKLQKLPHESKQKSSLVCLDFQNTRNLAKSYLCDLLASQYWQKKYQKNLPSIGGMLVIGPTNTGKDYILKAAMRAVNYQPEVHYQSLNAGPFVDIQAIKKKAMSQGLKLHIAEVDLWPSGLIEGAFNDVLTGQAPLGLRLYATANGNNYQDRQSFSAALLSRLQVFQHSDYSLAELKVLIQRQTELKEAVITQLMHVHTYFLGDGIASSRHALQAARLLSEGVPFVRACARAYADSLRLSSKKAEETLKTPALLSTIQAYLQIHYSVLQPLLRETHSRPCQYDAELKTLTLSTNHAHQAMRDSLLCILLAHLAFPLPEEQNWLEPLVTIIHQIRMISLFKQQYKKEKPAEKYILEMFTKKVSSEKKHLLPIWPVVQKIMAPVNGDLLALLTCLPQKLIPEDYKKTQQNALWLWNKVYEVVKYANPLTTMNIPVIENKYQCIATGQIVGSGFSKLNKKIKPLGKVQNFNSAPGTIYFSSAQSGASQPLEFKKNQLILLPLAPAPVMQLSDFKNLRPEFRITLEYCQSVPCGLSGDKPGFRILVPRGMSPWVIHEEKYLPCQQDANGFYIQLFSSQGPAITKIDEISYYLFKIPAQLEEKKLAVSAKSRDINHQNYFQAAAPELKNIIKEIEKNKQASHEVRLSSLNNLLKYFTGRFLYLNPDIDQSIIGGLDLIYNNQPTAHQITEWILNKGKGVCFEFAVAFYTICCDLFPDWPFELHQGYTGAAHIIKGIPHVWVVLSLPGKEPVIFDPTPSVRSSSSDCSSVCSSSSDYPSVSSNEENKEENEEENEEKWIRPIENKFFLSNSQILTTIQDKIVPLLQRNELRSTRVVYQDKPGTLDFHLAALGATQCFRLNRGLENHQYFSSVLILDYPRCPTPKTLNSWVVDIYFWEQVMKQGASVYLWTKSGAMEIRTAFDLIKSLPLLQKPDAKALKDWQEKQVQKPVLFDLKKYQLIFSKLMAICKELDDSAWSDSLLKRFEEKENKMLAKENLVSEDKLSFEFKEKIIETEESFRKQCIPIEDDDQDHNEKVLNIKYGKAYIYQDVKFADLKLKSGKIELNVYVNTRLTQQLFNHLAKISGLKKLEIYQIDHQSLDLNFTFSSLRIPADIPEIKFHSYQFDQKSMLNLFSHCACSKIEFEYCEFEKVNFPENNQIKEITFLSYQHNPPLVHQLGNLSQLNKLTFQSINSMVFINIRQILKEIKKPISLYLIDYYDSLDTSLLDLSDIPNIEEIFITRHSSISLAIDGFKLCKLIDQILKIKPEKLIVYWEDKSIYDLIVSMMADPKNALNKNIDQLKKLPFKKEMNPEKFLDLLFEYSKKIKITHRYEPLEIAQFIDEVNESLRLDSSNNDVKSEGSRVLRLG